MGYNYLYMNLEKALAVFILPLRHYGFSEGEAGELVKAAWKKGIIAAARYCGLRDGSYDFLQHLKKCGYSVEESDVEQVWNGRRHLGAIYMRTKQLVLHDAAIRHFSREIGAAYAATKQYVLAHEFYHFLESTEMGEGSRQHRVPRLKIGHLEIGKKRIPELSEIAAISFGEACTRDLR